MRMLHAGYGGPEYFQTSSLQSMPIGRTATVESYFFMCSSFVIISQIGLGCGTFAR